MARSLYRWYLGFMTSLTAWGAIAPMALKAAPSQITPTESPVSKAASPTEENPLRLAQLFYPPAKDQKLIRVIGKGSVRQAADVAEVQIFITGRESFDESFPGEGVPEEFPLPLPTPRETTQIQAFKFHEGSLVTEEDIKPLVEALVKSGIARNQISIKIAKSRPQLTPFPFPGVGGGNNSYVLVKVNSPTPDSIEAVVLTAETHLKNSSTLALDDVKVNYKINDCEQLKLQAFENAVQDAQKRAEAIASAMKAKLSAHASVAEPFFNMFVPGCESGEGFSLSGQKNSSYEAGDPIEVVIDRIIFFTYTLDE